MAYYLRPYVLRPRMYLARVSSGLFRPHSASFRFSSCSPFSTPVQNPGRSLPGFLPSLRNLNFILRNSVRNGVEYRYRFDPVDKKCCSKSLILLTTNCWKLQITYILLFKAKLCSFFPQLATIVLNFTDFNSICTFLIWCVNF